MIDTHTHLYLPQYSGEYVKTVERGLESGVKHFVLPNIDMDSLPMMHDLHDLFPEVTSMAIGLHPTEVKENWKEIVATMESALISGKYVAIGEVGMDLYWDSRFVEEQTKAFKRQLEIAEAYSLPVIIHSRSALKETLEAIESVNPGIPLIFHSFTGGSEEIRHIREICDPYFGINGVVTYKNAAELRSALPEIGIDRILLETDSPYLTPVPHRGKQNESSYLSFILTKISECLDMPKEEVERQTDLSAKIIFGLPD